MKIISINVNGIRAAARKGLYMWLLSQDADFICIQETKAQLQQLQDYPLYFPIGYYIVYCDAEKKGYSGVAIYARIPPLSIKSQLGCLHSDTEGRFLQFDYAKFSVISVYFPSGTMGDIRQNIKYDFLNYFAQYLKQLRKENRTVIICGDFNIAHKQCDLKNWRANQKHTGFLPEEREWMDALLGEMGFVDAFRVKNTQEGEYTWWSNRGQAWANNVGWRIDYQIITRDLIDAVQQVDIYKSQRFSDHAPLCITYKWN